MSDGRKKVHVKNIHGQKVTVFEGDYVGKKIIKHGIYEKPLLEYAGKILDALDHPVVFDIGANIGNHALSFSRHAEMIYAFEPVPDIFAVLSENVAQNEISNVQCVNTALSNTNGEADIFVFDANLGATSFDKHVDGLTSIKVSKRIGDDLVREMGITSVDFMKIDTEGHEAFVLQGLAETIKKNRPYVIVEWHDTLTIQRFREAKILEHIFSDYTVFVLGTNFDDLYWANKPFAKIRCRLAKLFSQKKSCLYAFDSTKAYKNILLVPHGKEHHLPR